jgi:polyhydroxyalkanoate synthesis regulator phasin
MAGVGRLPLRGTSVTVVSMPESDEEGLRRFIEAAEELAKATRTRAEEFVKELVHIGEEEDEDGGRSWMEDLVERSRKASDALLDIVRNEISSQLGALGVDSLEDVADKVADILRRSAEAGRAYTANATSTLIEAKDRTTERVVEAASAAKQAAEKAGAKVAPTRAGTKKAAQKKVPAQAPAKKASAKKTTTVKTATKKAPAKKATSAAKKGQKKAAAASPTAPKKAPSGPARP